jgi:hypothetical protein
MAGRSFKPASYLASATQAAPNRSPRQRPQFTRSSSASSVASTRSEDSVVGMLKSLVLEARESREGKEDAAATTGQLPAKLRDDACTLSGDGALQWTGMAPHHAYYPATECHLRSH